MRIWIWPLALMVSMVLACGKGEPPEKRAAAVPRATATPYTLKITFEGLVGYLNQSDSVWALLPNARADTLPTGVDTTNPIEFIEFPEHYAFLKVNGVNVQGSGVTKDLLIPIDGKEIWVTNTFTSTGGGIPPDEFHQVKNDPRDKLDPDVLTKNYPQLAARIRLPLIMETADDKWVIETAESPSKPPDDFADVDPKPSGSLCVVPDPKPLKNPRVQAVTWQKKMTGDVTLMIKSIGGIKLPPLVLVSGGRDIQVSIVNQELKALYDPTHLGHHWPAYRWFYNLSGVKSDCTKHYYPQGGAGGNRCPQKLYNE